MFTDKCKINYIFMNYNVPIIIKYSLELSITKITVHHIDRKSNPYIYIGIYIDIMITDPK